MLELLLGFTVLIVAIFALFAVFPTGDKAAMRAARMSQASEIARALMEEELNKNYSSLVLGTTSGLRTSQGLTRHGSQVETVYDYTITITEPDPSKKYRNILVEVWWEEGQEKRRHGCKLESSKCELI